MLSLCAVFPDDFLNIFISKKFFYQYLKTFKSNHHVCLFFFNMCLKTLNSEIKPNEEAEDMYGGPHLGCSLGVNITC